MSNNNYELSLFYPFNDIRTEAAVEKILNNLHLLPVEELEKLTSKIK